MKMMVESFKLIFETLGVFKDDGDSDVFYVSFYVNLQDHVCAIFRVFLLFLGIFFFYYRRSFAYSIISTFLLDKRC
jgi:hypothetical protein